MFNNSNPNGQFQQNYYNVKALEQAQKIQFDPYSDHKLQSLQQPGQNPQMMLNYLEEERKKQENRYLLPEGFGIPRSEILMAVNFLNFRQLDQKYYKKFPLMLPTKYIYGILDNDLKNYEGYLYPMEMSEIEEIQLKKKIAKLKIEQEKKEKKQEKVKKKLQKIKEYRMEKCENSLISQIGMGRFKNKYGCDEAGGYGGGGGSTQREKDRLAQEKEFEDLEQKILEGNYTDGELSQYLGSEDMNTTYSAYSDTSLIDDRFKGQPFYCLVKKFDQNYFVQVSPLLTRGDIKKGEVYKVWHGLVNILPSMDILNKLFKEKKAKSAKSKKSSKNSSRPKSRIGEFAVIESESEDDDDEISQPKSEMQLLIDKAIELESKNKEKAEQRKVVEEYKVQQKNELILQELKNDETQKIITMLGKSLLNPNSILFKKKKVTAEQNNLLDVSVLKTDMSANGNPEHDVPKRGPIDEVEAVKILSKEQLDEIKSPTDKEIETFNEEVASKFSEDRPTMDKKDEVDKMEEDLAHEIGSIVSEQRSVKSISIKAASIKALNIQIKEGLDPSKMDSNALIANVLVSDMDLMGKEN